MHDAHGRSIRAQQHECSCSQPPARTPVAVPIAKILATGLVASASVLAIGHIVAAAVTALASTSIAGLLLHLLIGSKSRD